MLSRGEPYGFWVFFKGFCRGVLGRYVKVFGVFVFFKGFLVQVFCRGDVMCFWCFCFFFKGFLVFLCVCVFLVFSGVFLGLLVVFVVFW